MGNTETQLGDSYLIDTTPYIPSEEALKFVAFIRAAGLESHASPELHYRMADAFFSPDKKDWNTLIECTRGIGKSTVAEYLVIYIGALGHCPNFGPVPFLVFLGASQEGNVKQFFKNVASKIHNSDFLKSLFLLDKENYRQTDSEMTLTNLEGVSMEIVGKGMSVNWRGARSSNGHRPSMILADDVLHNDSMTSEAIRRTIETNWFNSALPALETTKHKVLFIGTPMSEDDLLHKLKNSGAYNVLRFALCSKFPCAEEDYDSIWPDKFPYEYALNMYKQYEAAGMALSFYTEYLLQITDLSTLLVEEDDIKWYDHDNLIRFKHRYNFYISTDFATSQKKSADFGVIAVWAISSNGDWLLVDGQCVRKNMQDTIDDLFFYVSKWKPLSVGLETSGQQGGFLSLIENLMMERNIWFQFAKKKGSNEPGIRPLRDKLHRFVTGVQPMFKQGKVWFPRPDTLTGIYSMGLAGLVEEMGSELSKLTMAAGVKALKHDDAIDILNQLSEMDTFSPSEELATPTPESMPKARQHYWPDVIEDDDDMVAGSTIF